MHTALLETIQSDLGTALLGFVLAGMIWGLRLEGAVKSQGKALEQMSKRCDTQDLTMHALESGHNALSLKVSEDLGKIRESLARIEGKFSQ